MINKPRRLACVLLAGLFILGCSNTTQAPKIELSEDLAAIQLIDFNFSSEKELSENIRVFVLKEGLDTIQPNQSSLLGNTELSGNQASFTPTLPFLAGNNYMILVKQGSNYYSKHFSIPSPASDTRASVLEIYPTSGTIPLNILKFYIQFDQPMAEGRAYENIHFLTAQGDTLQDVFLELEEELWSSDLKRMTLLLDPGRIKQGLQSFEELGYSFEVGKEYTLSIGNEMLDANGQALTSAKSKTYVVSDAIHKRAGKFRIIETPKKNTKQKLTLRFERPHDFALLQRTISIHKEGEQIEGKVNLSENETVWEFEPEQAWAAGTYQIRVENLLEDLAGNNIINVFDVDNRTEQTQFADHPYATSSFTVK